MSHFTVLVMGPNLIDDDHLDAALAPFHEFECTGEDDQYVVDVDKTEEARAAFTKSTKMRVRGPDGTLHDPFINGNWKPEFSVQKDDGPFSRRELALPEGYERVDIPTADVESFAEWVEGYYGFKPVKFGEEPDRSGDHKYGYILLNADGEVEKCVDRTNPNAKWDWYQLGGRWQGSLMPKPNAPLDAVRVGRTGLGGGAIENADLVRKDQLDFDRMKAANVAQRQAGWDQTYAKMKEASGLGDKLTEEQADAIRYALLTSWKAAQSQLEAGLITLEKGENLWAWFQRTGDEVVTTHMDNILGWFNSTVSDSGEFQKIADWIADAPAIHTYAALIDGKWIAKGEMGWFGMSTDAKDPKSWDAELNKLVANLPDDHYLAVVDCHI